MSDHPDAKTSTMDRPAPSLSQSDHSHELSAEQVRLLYRQTPSVFFANLVNATFLGSVLWGHVSKHGLIAWLTAVAVLTLARYVLVRSFYRTNPPAHESARWGRLFVYGVFLSGLLWGTAGGFFFVERSNVHQLFLAFVLGGMAAGGMSTLSSYPGAYVIFLAPTIIPYVIRAIAQGDDVHLVMGLMFLLFVIMMWTISQRLHKVLTDSLRLRFENLGLLRQLVTARDHQSIVNQELEFRIREKLHAEKALQKANEELEIRVKERTQELALSNEVLEREKELFRVTLASIGDAVITTDFQGHVTYLNPVAEQLTGWNNRESLGAPLKNIFCAASVSTQKTVDDPLAGLLSEGKGEYPVLDYILVRRDEHAFAIDHSVAPIRDNKDRIIGAVLTFRDVTEQRKLTQKLAYEAAHDPLTGLLNRSEFEGRLARVLASATADSPHALLYLDLDQFKIVNDTCGHIAGDELLRQVTALLQSKLRARDTLARLGGDEFGIILERCPQAEAVRIAHSLRELVQGFRFVWQDKSFTVGVSIGLLPITRNDETLENVLSAADSACYAAKDSGRNRVHTYQPDDSLLQRRAGQMLWLPRIQRALEEDRLCLFLQPIVPVTPKLALEEHGEILLRMRDEQGQLILPGAFLPSAERNDQMPAIDRWVVSRCLKFLAAYSLSPIKVSYAINLSAQSLGNEDFLDFVVEKVKITKVDPSTLCFEISENSALADTKNVIQFIASLKEIGCQFSLDDFGSGLSSFGCLKDIPLDYLKIDGRLVKNMAADSIDRAMVEAIHRIGHEMGLKTIAEWTENAATMRMLETIGVDYVQGFWLAEPRHIDGSSGSK